MGQENSAPRIIPTEISRILKYAPAKLIGRESVLSVLSVAWEKVCAGTTPRPHVFTFVALGGEGKTSLVAKWAAELAAQDWPGCDAVFAWSFYSQGTRDQTAVSSDTFLAAALTFFGDAALAGSPAGAFDKGRRLAQLVGERRALLILDGLEPLQYAPTSPTPGELKDQGIAALLKGLATASRGLCVVTTRYSLPDLKAFWQTTAKEEKLLRLSREAGAHLLKTLGVKGSELRNLPLDSPSSTEAPKGAIYDSPGQRPGLAAENGPSALKGRDKTIPCDAPTGHADLGDAGTQGVALGCPIAGRWPARSPDGRELVNEYEQLVEDVRGHALTLNLLGTYLRDAHAGDIRQRDRVKLAEATAEVQGGHAFHVMDAYVKWLESGGTPASGPARSGGASHAGPEAGAPNATGQRALALLRLLGLFDRPATADCLGALLQAPAIPGLTESLVGLSETQRNLALTRLEDAKLLIVNRDAAGTLLALDAHPLIREYFGERMKDEGRRMKAGAAPSAISYQPSSFHLAHRRLYEHLCASTKEGTQPTLEDLQPLYQAVAHGCQAGWQQEACDKVYRDRLQRGQERYSTFKLGALGSDLGAVACFFETPWSRLSPALGEVWQAWLLNEAAFTLRALGRLTEALEPMRAALEMGVQQENWKAAAIRASNLSELELTLGAVAGAVGDAEQSVTYADRSGDAFQRMSNRTTHADALHQAGRRAEAEARFREAEQMQQERQPAYPLLNSLGGFLYCDLLLADAERAAWRRVLGSAGAPPAVFGALAENPARELSTPPGQPTRASAGSARGGRAPQLASCRAVSERAAQTLKIAEQNRLSLLTLALDHLTLGRAALYAAILGSSRRGELREPPSSAEKPAEGRESGARGARPSEMEDARRELDVAVSGLRRAGTTHHIPRALLTRAWLRSLTDALTGPESAQSDLDEAWEIAERGPMPLHLADIHLHRARLFGMQNEECRMKNGESGGRKEAAAYPWESPQADLVAARRLIQKHGYLRRLPELEDAEQCFIP